MIDSDYIRWDADDTDNPARRASQRSYDAVARKARAQWLALFAEDAVVEDPVGPSHFDPDGTGHRGRDGIGSFWDEAITRAPGFHFWVHESFANGNGCANLVTISVRDGYDLVMATDVVATYRVGEDGLITRMTAFWEPARRDSRLGFPRP